MKMKWGSKKPSHSSSRTSLIDRVFSVSWFSKRKQRGGTDSLVDSGKMKQRGKLDCPTPNSSAAASWKEGRFYGMDGDDGFWRLSFGEERVGGRKSIGGINPLWYDSEDEFQVPFSRFKSFDLKEMGFPGSEGSCNFNDMVLDVKKMKEKKYKEKILRENGRFRSKKRNGGGEFSNLRRKPKLSCRVVREKQALRDIFVVEPDKTVEMKEDSWDSKVSYPRKQHHVSFPNLGLTPIEEDGSSEAMNGEISNSASKEVPISWRNWDDEEFKEMNFRTEAPRKSAYVCRGSYCKKVKHNNRVRSYSPRTECKIRALEDMKKIRTKLKKKATEKQPSEGRNIFDSFAVVKSSFDPEQDFRDSMAEMIGEKGIRRSEELEELLACYLTLNSDGYHNLIIKVFRQVWFELNGMHPF